MSGKNHRVFFLTEKHALAAVYQPCGNCLPVAYASWKAQQIEWRQNLNHG